MVVLKWVTFSGSVPEHTFKGGNRGNGEALGVARAVMPNGELTGGKFYIKGKSSYIPWGGKEHVEKTFQVLTVESGNVKWEAARDGDVPKGAIIAGTINDGSTAYVGRGRADGELIPGKVIKSHECCYVGTGWKEHSLKQYEVLVSDETIHVYQDTPLPGAENACVTAILKWVTFSGKVPEYTFHAGHRDGGKEALGVARAVMPNGELTGGKFHSKGKNCYIPWGGKENVPDAFQVLTVESGYLVWETARDGEVPMGAVVVGNVSDGSLAYVGRGTVSGELLPGKVVKSHGCCYVGTGWKEHSLKEYEVLVACSEVRVSEDSPLPGA